MKKSNILKNFAAFIMSVVGAFPVGSVSDDEQRAPLWAAVIISLLGGIVFVPLLLAGWALWTA